jgi:hypothetical protein
MALIASVSAPSPQVLLGNCGVSDVSVQKSTGNVYCVPPISSCAAINASSSSKLLAAPASVLCVSANSNYLLDAVGGFLTDAGSVALIGG